MSTWEREVIVDLRVNAWGLLKRFSQIIDRIDEIFYTEMMV